MHAEEYRRTVRDSTIEYLRDHTSQTERKELMKKALNEWLRERFAEFGWFSFKVLAAAVFVAVMYVYLTSQGWRR